MKNMRLAAVAVAALAVAGSASAEGKFSYNLGATSDYVFRGFSQTDGKAAIQGGIDYSNGIYYAGTWASNVDQAFGPKGYELDLYAGIKPTYEKFAFDLGVITYQYGTEGYNTTEFKAAVSHPLYKGTIGAAFYDNIDYGSTFYYEINGSYPLTDKLSLSGAVGEQDLYGFKYSTANLGLTYAINPTWSIDGRLSDTNIPEWFTPAKPRIAVTVKAAF